MKSTQISKLSSFVWLSSFRLFAKNLKKKSKEFCIVIALANYKAYPDYTIVKSLPGIVELILKNLITIFLEPHPANREHFKKDRFKKIFDIIDNNKRVKIRFI